MTMKSTKDNKFLYLVTNLMIIIPFVFYVTGIHPFFSSPLSISIVSVLLTLCLLVYFDKIFTMPIFLTFIFFTGSLIVNMLKFGDLGVVFASYNIFILLLLFNNISFDKEQVQRIRLLTIILLGVFLLTTKITPFYDTVKAILVGGDMINNNTVGILWLAFYYIFYSWFDEIVIRKDVERLVYIIVTVITVRNIESLSCRSAILAIMLFAIALFYRKKIQKSYQKYLAAAVIFALVFPNFYVLFSKIFNDMNFMGKSLFARVMVWESAFDIIKVHPYMGSGTLYVMRAGLESFTDSAHNVFLGWWKTVGIIPLYVIIRYLLRGKNIEGVTDSNIIPKLMFLSCMIVCTLETLLNDSNTYFFFMLLLMNIKEETKEVAE